MFGPHQSGARFGGAQHRSVALLLRQRGRRGGAAVDLLRKIPVRRGWEEHGSIYSQLFSGTLFPFFWWLPH